ncbi:MAG: toast rack family protein [Anaerolineae bacterium]|nr:toast rack family protein [Anaerolineae bacterium]
MSRMLFVVPLLLLATALSACQLMAVTTGEMQEISEVVERQDAREARVTVQIGAGELNVSSGARDLMEGTFTFNVAEWRPEIAYTVTGTTGDLRVQQPNVEAGLGFSDRNVTNRWDLRFSDALPLEMTVRLGAGENRLNLADLNVRRLSLETGAGETTLLAGGNLRDLDVQGGVGELEVNLATGTWAEDLTAHIRGGVGSTLLILPADVGVRVEVQQGLGSVNASGLAKDGNVYTNAAYGQSDATLSLRVESGVGEVTLQGLTE